MTTSSSGSARESSGRKKLVFGSRRSALAQWQTREVGNRLVALNANLQFFVHHISTRGDQQIDQPLPEIGGKGLFTAELDRALLRNEIDVAVHSLKDLPTQLTGGLTIVPVLERDDPRDVLISRDGQTLVELPPGATVGTSSYRRQSQLLALRPDLNVRPIRGNVPTRIAKLKSESYDAVVLAAAGVGRLDCQAMITERLSLENMLPAPGQAIIAATCRADDLETVSMLTAISDRQTTDCATAERTFLSALGGGCSAPIAAYARFEAAHSEAKLTLTGRVASIDGRQLITEQGVGVEPGRLAQHVAQRILAAGGSRLVSCSDTN